MSPQSRRTDAQGSFKAIAFGDLPPEMLMSIISHIDNEADLLNLSLVSKQVNALVQPALYSSYRNFNMEDSSRSITPFLRNILKNESLARACKKVDLGEWSTVLDAWQGYGPSDRENLSSDDFELFANAAKNSNITQTRHSTRNIEPWRPQEEAYEDATPRLDAEQDFLRILRAGLDEPQVVLMLSCLPRIEELCMRGVDIVEEPSVWRAMVFNTNTLRTLTLSRSPGASDFRFHGFESVLRLPSLRELRALCPRTDRGPRSDDDPVLDLEEKSISLTHVTLEGASFSANCMSSFIAACEHLVQFTYTIDNRFHEGAFHVPHDHFTLPQLKKWLLAHKDSLKHLTIDFNKWPYSHDYKTIGSMDQFTALETYAIDYGALQWHPTVRFEHMGTANHNSNAHDTEANLSSPLPTLLPSSLREITILHSPPMVVEGLMALEETPVDKLPRLDRINLHFAICTFDNYPLYKAARDMLQDAGIRLFAGQKYPRKTLEKELIDSGGCFRTHWDEGNSQYVSTPAQWDEDEPYQHDLCAYHSEILPREFERTLNVSQGLDPDDEGGMDPHLLDAILDYHGIAPYMHGFFGDDYFDFDDEFDDDVFDELDDQEIIDDMGDYMDEHLDGFW